MWKSRFELAGLSRPGRVRKRNHDRLYVDSKKNFFVLADGAGGHVYAGCAAQLAVDTVAKCLRDRSPGSLSWLSGSLAPPLAELLPKAFNKANRELARHAAKSGDKVRMASTLVAGIFRKDRCYCASVGDSRLYHFHEGRLSLVSEDQNLATKLISSGALQADDPQLDRYRHMLTQAIGGRQDKPLQVQMFDLEMGPESWVLACTDGLTNMISERHLEVMVDFEQPMQNALVRLIDSAERAGGLDNISVVMGARTGLFAPPGTFRLGAYQDSHVAL